MVSHQVQHWVPHMLLQDSSHIEKGHWEDVKRAGHRTLGAGEMADVRRSKDVIYLGWSGWRGGNFKLWKETVTHGSNERHKKSNFCGRGAARVAGPTDPQDALLHPPGRCVTFWGGAVPSSNVPDRAWKSCSLNALCKGREVQEFVAPAPFQ